MQGMEEPYGEGLASHTGSESCGHGRKAMDEALTAFDRSQGAVTGARNLAGSGGFESLLWDEVRQVKADSPLVLSAR